MSAVLSVIVILLKIYTYVIIISAILSFVLPPYHAIRTFLDRLVDPLLQPIRRIIPSVGGLDFSPIVLYLFVELLIYLISRLA